LWLLGQYFPSYTPTIGGSGFGILYGFVVGFIAGWSVAFLRNSVTRIYVSILRRRVEVKTLEELGFFPDAQSGRSFEKDE
jgi:hypothetical protein